MKSQRFRTLTKAFLFFSAGGSHWCPFRGVGGKAHVRLYPKPTPQTLTFTPTYAQPTPIVPRETTAFYTHPRVPTYIKDTRSAHVHLNHAHLTPLPLSFLAWRVLILTPMSISGIAKFHNTISGVQFSAQSKVSGSSG